MSNRWLNGRRMTGYRGLIFLAAAAAAACAERPTEPSGLDPSFGLLGPIVRRSDWIVFSSSRAGYPSPPGDQIWKMRPDGSLLQQLTSGEADFGPVFSPDLTKIAYTALVPWLETFEIFVMNADGTGQTQLTSVTTPDPEPGNQVHPTWSPDGTRIAFMRDAQIYVMNADGSGRTNLTNSTTFEFDPTWSPNGRYIAFSSNRNGNVDICLIDMSVRGRPVTCITETSFVEWAPAWSPRGDRLAFISNRDGPLNLYTMRLDGSDVTRLTSDMGEDADPAWSPDGTQIVFAHYPGFPGWWDLYTINADGSGRTALTDVTVDDDQTPHWAGLRPRAYLFLGEAATITYSGAAGGFMVMLGLNQGILEASQTGEASFSLQTTLRVSNDAGQVGQIDPKTNLVAHLKVESIDPKTNLVAVSFMVPWDGRDQSGVAMTGAALVSYSVQLFHEPTGVIDPKTQTPVGPAATGSVVVDLGGGGALQ